jgi:hypothetical protein
MRLLPFVVNDIGIRVVQRGGDWARIACLSHSRGLERVPTEAVAFKVTSGKGMPPP